MSKSSAKFAAAVVCMVGGLTLTVSLHAASAGDECLTEPKGPSPQGKHWYYHTERGTQRHCWYLRGQDDTVASSTSQDQSAATDDEGSSTKDQVVAERDQSPPAKPPAKRAAKQIEPPAMRSIADARAELPARARVDDANTAPPAVAPASPNARNASVWPDPQAAFAAKPVVDTSSSDTDTPPDTTASIVPQPSSSPAPVAQAPFGDRHLGDRHLGSIPMLLLVALSALGLAGLTGSTVYRLASARRRVRPEDRWIRNVALQPAPPRRPQRHISAGPEPIQDNFVESDFAQDDFARDEFERDEFEQDELEQDEFEQDEFEQDHYELEHLAREPIREARFEPRPEAARAEARFEPRPEAPRAEARTSDSNHRREQIEAYLAQLTRQLQADLEATTRAE